MPRNVSVFVSFLLLAAFGGLVDGPGEHGRVRSTGASFVAEAPAAYTGTCTTLADIAAMPEATWCLLAGSNLSAVAPDPIPPGIEGQKAVVDVWCGAAHDTSRNQLLISCGGHAAYAGNEIYALDFDTPESGWARIWGPSDNADIPACPTPCETYDDGTMSSRHTYNGIIYDPVNDALLFYGGAPWSQPGGSTGEAWKFDLSTQGWTQRTQPFGGNGFLPTALWDPDNSQVMVVQAVDYPIKLHNTTADTYSLLGDAWDGPSAYYSTPYYDTVRDLIISFGSSYVAAIDTVGGAYTELTTTNCTTPAGWSGPGAAWYPTESLGVIYRADTADTSVWVFDYSTLTCTEIPVSGENLATLSDNPIDHGTFSRWQYIPSIDRFVAITDVTKDVRLYRMPDHYTIQAAHPDNVIAYSFEDTGDSSVIQYDTFQAVAGISLNAFVDRTGHVEITPADSASGDKSLHFIIASEWGADSGSFYANFSSDNSVQFSEGDGFYVQWRQKFSQVHLSNVYVGGGGWKQAIIGEGDRAGYFSSSCTNMEVVPQNTNHRGYIQGYDHCPPVDAWQYSVPPSDFDLQYPGGTCLYQSYGSNKWLDSSPGCFKFLADEWMTFEVYVEVGTWGVANSTVRMWVAGEGDAPTLLFDMSPATGGARTLYQESGASAYGKVWLLPYDSGKDAAAAHTPGDTWYDGLLVSTSPIPFPGGYPLP